MSINPTLARNQINISLALTCNESLALWLEQLEPRAGACVLPAFSLLLRLRLRLRDHARTDGRTHNALRRHSAHNNAVCNSIADTGDSRETSVVVGMGD